MTAKESRELHAQEHDKSSRAFYVGCAEHALPHASLPEFQEALSVFKAYDASPTDENLRALKEAHENLKRATYPYTAIDQYRLALVTVIHNVISGLHSVNLSDAVYFSEAVFCASRKLGVNASHCSWLEGEYQADLWNRCFPS